MKFFTHIVLLFFSTTAFSVEVSPEQLADLSKEEVSWVKDCARYLPETKGKNPFQLNFTQSLALYEYTYATFTHIASGLWGVNKLSDCDKKSIAKIDSSLEQIPSLKGIFFRGTEVKHYANEKKGDTFEFKSFMSTSKTPFGASYFIRDAYMIVKAKNAKLIYPYSSDVLDKHFDGEDEYLFRRNTKFRITKDPYYKKMTVRSLHEGSKKMRVLVFEVEEI